MRGALTLPTTSSNYKLRGISVTEARIPTRAAVEQPLRRIRVSSSNIVGVVVISESVSLPPAL
jgi:hypothetical protein